MKNFMRHLAAFIIGVKSVDGAVEGLGNFVAFIFYPIMFFACWYMSGSFFTALIVTCIFGPILFLIIGFAVLLPLAIILMIICEIICAVFGHGVEEELREWRKSGRL